MPGRAATGELKGHEAGGRRGRQVTGWRDGFVRAYDPGSGGVLWEIANAHRGAVTSLYADANYVLSGGQEGAGVLKPPCKR